VNCPGNNWGRGTLRANPVPSTGLVNRVPAALRDWVMRGIDPPPSQWPTLIDKTLVEPTKEAMGFPSGVPGIPDSIFLAENFIFPVFDYDWGPQFNESDAIGVPSSAACRPFNETRRSERTSAGTSPSTMTICSRPIVTRWSRRRRTATCSA
jgi:hypothetical protein